MPPPSSAAGLTIVSFFVLVKKSWSKSGSGFAYAFCAAWFLLNSMFLLLAGVVLTGAKHHTHQFEASPFWSKSGEGEQSTRRADLQARRTLLLRTPPPSMPPAVQPPTRLSPPWSSPSSAPSSNWSCPWR